MPDREVRQALRSDAPLVLVEAPAGCGKTHQGAEYAAESGAHALGGRTLILAHTHAACDAFSLRTRNAAKGVEVRTIDSLVAEIADAYRPSLGIDVSPQLWVRGREDGFRELAAMVASLVGSHPMIAQAVAARYPLIICDEHQDASAAQHDMVMHLLAAGTRLRIFGDTMQRIYGRGANAAVRRDEERRWAELKASATVARLEHPHRWNEGSPKLGDWVLQARRTLEDGGVVDLSGSLPHGLQVIEAENVAQRNLAYRPSEVGTTRISRLVTRAERILVLSHHNETVRSLRASWGRKLPIWEGHTRNHLISFVASIKAGAGDPLMIADATIAFCQNVFTGFSPSAFGTRLRTEVANGASGRVRGVTAELQAMARRILDRPDHRGAAALLQDLNGLRRSHRGFSQVHLDYSHEFWDAVNIGKSKDPEEGLADVLAARAHRPRPLPPKVLSTVHKAKGLQADHVMILPCDATTFRENDRSLLYVAISRASHSLTLVVSREKPSPLLCL